MPTVIHDLYSMLRLFILWLVLSRSWLFVDNRRIEPRAAGWVARTLPLCYAYSVEELLYHQNIKKLIIIQLSVSNGTNSFQLSSMVWASPTDHPTSFLQHLKMNRPWPFSRQISGFEERAWHLHSHRGHAQPHRGRLVRKEPSTGNANRWHDPCQDTAATGDPPTCYLRPTRHLKLAFWSLATDMSMLSIMKSLFAFCCCL